MYQLFHNDGDYWGVRRRARNWQDEVSPGMSLVQEGAVYQRHKLHSAHRKGQSHCALNTYLYYESVSKVK